MYNPFFNEKEPPDILAALLLNSNLFYLNAGMPVISLPKISK